MPRKGHNTGRKNRTSVRKHGAKAGKRGRTDWRRVDSKTDQDIERDVAADPDAAPIFTDEMFEDARWIRPPRRVPIALKVDPEVLAFFKEPGPGYQSRMNAVLRAFVEKARSSGR